MKKVISMLLLGTYICSFCACGQNNTPPQVESNTTVVKATVEEITAATTQPNTTVVKATESETEETTSPEEKIKKVSIGKTIKTEDYDFTLRKVELSYDVNPDNPPSYYTHYPAENGQVYIHVDADIKNTQKQDLECDEIYGVKADYDDGYTYDGFAVAEDTDGDFTYANITQVNPLQTLGVHTLVDCPEEVETSDKSLKIIITMSDDSQYEYVIRK